MARSIQEIKNEMGDAFIANMTLCKLYGIKKKDNDSFDTLFSRASLESILFFIVASSLWVIEKLFDTHKKEVQKIIDTQKPHTLRWYAEKTKAFMKGVELPLYSDSYDLSLLDEKKIEEKRIITHVAVSESESANRIRIKVATTKNEKIKPLSDASDVESLKAYLNQIKDAGVWLDVDSPEPDFLALKLKVYLDPLLFPGEGRGKEGFKEDKEPVRVAVDRFLTQLPYNGMLVPTYLEEELKKVEGVVIAHVTEAYVKYAQGIRPIKEKYMPVGGFFQWGKITSPEGTTIDGLEITYEKLNPLQ